VRREAHASSLLSTLPSELIFRSFNQLITKNCIYKATKEKKEKKKGGNEKAKGKKFQRGKVPICKQSLQ
jgi:hypothetical protein